MVMASGHLGHDRVRAEPHQRVVGIMQDHWVFDDDAEFRHDGNRSLYRIHTQDLVSIPSPCGAVQMASRCPTTQHLRALPVSPNAGSSRVPRDGTLVTHSSVIRDPRAGQSGGGAEDSEAH